MENIRHRGFAANWLALSFDRVIQNGLIVVDGDNKVTEIDSLNMVLPREPERTVFCSGCLAPDSFVLPACLPSDLLEVIQEAYRHIEVSDVREGDHISLFNYYVDESGKVRRVQLI